MVTGQYRKQNGIIYGGTHLEEVSNQHIHNVCKHFITTHGTLVNFYTGLVQQPRATATAAMRRAVACLTNPSSLESQDEMTSTRDTT